MAGAFSRVWLRAELRARWRSWLALALLAGLVGGASIALAAGARRTTSAYPRLVAEQRAPDIFLIPQVGYEEPIEVLAQLDTVASVARVHLFFTHTEAEARPGGYFGSFVDALVPEDTAGQEVFARGRLVAGRAADPAAADEAEITQGVADGLDLAVGDQLTLRFVSTDDLAAAFADGATPPPDSGEPRQFEVVGIHAAAGKLPPVPLGAGMGDVILTPAFLTEARRAGYSISPAAGVFLTAGPEGLEAFLSEAHDHLTEDISVRSVVEVLEDRHDATRQALRTPARALWLLSGLTAVVGLLVVGQTMASSFNAEGADRSTLWALGVTRPQLVAAELVRAAALGAVAGLLAAVVAGAASPMFPLGLGRLAEPDPGVRLDATALVVGGIAVALVILATGAVGALRRARTSRMQPTVAARSRTYASRLVDWLIRRGAGPPIVAGTALALPTARGKRAAPRAIAGVALGIAVIVAALGFGAGLDRLLRTPELYGWGWDAQFGDGFGGDRYYELEPELLERDDLSAVSVGTTAEVTLDGEPTSAIALTGTRGDIGPTVMSGRAPDGPDEVMVGGRFLDRLELGIGDDVEVDLQSLYVDHERPDGSRPRTLRVVGTGLFPERFGVRLGDGVVLTLEGLTALARKDVSRNIVFARFAAGVDHQDAITRLPQPPQWALASPPEDLVNFGRVENAPALIGALMGVVAATLLIHTLATAVSRRRRDLAVLKVLGFDRRQVTRTVVAQAMVLVVPGLLIGVPLGIALGRWSWIAAARQLYVVAEPAIPVLAVLFVVPATLAVATLAAVAPAWSARRTSPATTLRTE